MKQPETPIVGLFATCLVDLYRPTVGFATAALLERAGCSVEVPPRQVCCGQPAYNSGNRRAAEAIARQTIASEMQFPTGDELIFMVDSSLNLKPFAVAPSMTFGSNVTLKQSPFLNITLTTTLTLLIDINLLGV